MHPLGEKKSSDKKEQADVTGWSRERLKSSPAKTAVGMRQRRRGLAI
jgi:hypothetical protein